MSGVPERAEVVIVGGGVMGASIAFHLAEAGVKDVLLLERGELAGGSTSRAAGGVRAQFSDPLNVRLGQRSLEAFADFGRRPGWEIDLRRVGYLFLLTREEDVQAFTASVELQNELGVPSRMISPEEARELSPLIEIDDVIAAAWSPEDGHATPEAVVQGYASGARKLGATILTGAEVTAIDREGDSIVAVRCGDAAVRTGVVVCAAGAWSAAVGEMAGVPLPVEPLRRQVLYTEPMAGLPEHVPMTIDFSTGFYFHREGQGLLMGMGDPAETPGSSSRPPTTGFPR